MNDSFDAHNRASWFFGQMNRDEAVEKLQRKNHGTFLVRKSPRAPDDYVLSVSQNGRVMHYKIVRQSDNTYMIGDLNFQDLPQLLDHYKVNLLDTTTLISPLEVPRTQPEPMTQPRLSKELVKAIYDFAGTDDEDLPFRRGEILEVIEKQEEKWWRAKNDEGKIGTIPVPYVSAFTKSNPASSGTPSSSPGGSRPPSHNDAVLARVIMRRVPNAYDPQALPLDVNDIIEVTRRNVNGQWEGRIRGTSKEGHFPFTHVKIIDASEASSRGFGTG